MSANDVLKLEEKFEVLRYFLVETLKRNPTFCQPKSQLHIQFQDAIGKTHVPVKLIQNDPS